VIDSPAAAPPLISSVLRTAATVAFVIALPTFLITSGVRQIALGQGFYLDEFAKYRVGAVTGLSQPELHQVAQAFIQYFLAPPQRMDQAVALPGGRGPLFNQRELDHMVDVQLLMHRVFDVWTLSLVVLLASGLLIIVVHPATGGPALVRAGAIGGALAVIIVGTAAVASMVNFSAVFTQFHFLSFTNDLWVLDPRTDRLIQLFPLGFFFDAALRIGVQTVALGAVVFAVSIAGLRVMR
jgi:integral membrane protein (TIGR01906 family)